MKMNTSDPSIVPLAPGMTPLRWQVEAMLAIRRDLREFPETLVSAATGTGKGTLAAALVVKAARAGKRVLFLVHMDELINDVMERAIAIEPALYAGKVKAKQNEIDRQVVFCSMQTMKGKRLDDIDKFPFDYVITDECFVAGTPIRMADGSDKAIEDVRVGDRVLAYDEASDTFCAESVTETMVRHTMQTVSITVGMVRLRCTANHPFFTRRGWVRAADLTTDDEVKRATIPSRHLRSVWQREREALSASFAAFVLRAMPGGAGAGEEASSAVLNVRRPSAGTVRVGNGVGATGPGPLLSNVCGGVPFSPFFGNHGGDESCSRIGTHEGEQSHDEPGDSREGVGHADCDGASAHPPWRERARTHHGGDEVGGGPGLADERDLLRRARKVSWLPDELQDRRGQRGAQDCDRDRRFLAQFREGEGSGQEEAGAADFARVDGVEVHERGGDESTGGVPVYNIGVARVHTYVAAGIVVHNCHHSPSRSYRAIYARCEKVNPKWKHIGLTATPFRNAGGGKTAGLGLVFPRLAYEYSLADAIAEGALCPLRGIKVRTEIDLTGVDPDDEDALEKLIDTHDRNHVVAETYVAHCVTDGDRSEVTVTEAWSEDATPREVTRTLVVGGVRKQAIVFACTIAHARNIATELCKWGIVAEPVWGTDKERTRKIGAFKSGTIDVLCNNNLLSEGFDHKPVGAVLLVRPTQSRGLYAQQVGRATRKSPGKLEGLVIDFVANSDTHDLASLADLSRPDSDLPRIEPGAEVRHRRDAAKSKGMVESVDGWVSNDEQGTALVLWKQGAADLGIVAGEPVEEEARNLLLIKPPMKAANDDEIVINPTVIGVNEFSISLFGEPTKGQRLGWYTYTDSKKHKHLVAKGKDRDESAMIRHRDETTWEAWRRTGEAIRLAAVGSFAECEAAVSDMTPGDYTEQWMRAAASEKQVETLAKFGVRRAGLSKGEASMILVLKIMSLRIGKGQHAPPLLGGWADAMKTSTTSTSTSTSTTSTTSTDDDGAP